MPKKKHAEHVNLERWLVSYADFITLLFAFFVVMYALSMQNLAKVKAAAESIRKAFGGPATIVHGDLRSETQLSPFDGPPDPSGDLHRIKSEVDRVASLETGASDLGERMDTLIDKRGLTVRLTAADFFAPGEAAVRADLRPMLDRIGRIVAQGDRPVRIEGFSDEAESKSPGFASDWELSAARAAWVAKYWISRFEIDPGRLTAAGLSHYHPLVTRSESEQSQWARGRNRRIEVVILN